MATHTHEGDTVMTHVIARRISVNVVSGHFVFVATVALRYAVQYCILVFDSCLYLTVL